jgi:hypothetical protein
MSIILRGCDMHTRLARYTILMALVKESSELMGTQNYGYGLYRASLITHDTILFSPIVLQNSS